VRRCGVGKLGLLVGWCLPFPRRDLASFLVGLAGRAAIMHAHHLSRPCRLPGIHSPGSAWSLGTATVVVVEDVLGRVHWNSDVDVSVVVGQLQVTATRRNPGSKRCAGLCCRRAGSAIGTLSVDDLFVA